MSKIKRGELGELEVVNTLKGLKEYHHLLNNVTFLNKKSDMSHQIDHILIHPHGIFVIETKNYYGEITYDETYKQWYKTIKGKRSKMPNPLLQNKSHEITIYRVLKGTFKAISVVVFVRNNAPYFPNDNVINLEDLLLFIESYPYTAKLSKTTIDNIKNVIENNSVDISSEKHVENIKLYKAVRREERKEIRYAIEHNKCPRCKSDLISQGYEYRCSKCDFSFKL